MFVNNQNKYIQFKKKKKVLKSISIVFKILTKLIC